ncbi:MAG: hypothetical protein RI906_3059 [Pseudomonadota bacterium]|jgi:hypothetical protein
MKVFDLSCSQEHRFEGWFNSEQDYDDQCARALVECPLCGDRQVRRLLSAPRLNLSRSGPEQSPPSAVQASNLTPEQLQAVWLKAARYIVENTEDVGERFAEEARRIHYDEAPERSIRGTASAEQTAALAEEGIAVMALPLPEIAKSRLQ